MRRHTLRYAYFHIYTYIHTDICVYVLYIIMQSHLEALLARARSLTGCPSHLGVGFQGLELLLRYLRAAAAEEQEVSGPLKGLL